LKYKTTLCFILTILMILCLGSLGYASTLPSPAFLYSSPVSANIHQWYLYGEDKGDGYAHVGVDFLCPENTSVKAARSGYVVEVGYSSAYGNYIIMNHYEGAWNYWTRYAHLNQVDLPPNTFVRQGDQIGLSGATGNVTGPHLHFEVLYQSSSYGNTLNPEVMLSQSKASPYGAIYGFVSDSSGQRITHVSITGLQKDSSVVYPKSFGTLYSYLPASSGDTKDVTQFSMNYCTGQLLTGSFSTTYSKTGYTSRTVTNSITSGGATHTDLTLN